MAIAPPPSDEPAPRFEADAGPRAPTGDDEPTPHVEADDRDLSFPTDSVSARLRDANIRGGATWMFWIAALSLINVGAAVSGSNWSFSLGLVVSQVVTYLGVGMGEAGAAPALGYAAAALGAGIALAFGALGLPARRGAIWAFLTALVLYALDFVVLLGLSAIAGEADVFGIGIHVWALWAMSRGLGAARNP